MYKSCPNMIIEGLNVKLRKLKEMESDFLLSFNPGERSETQVVTAFFNLMEELCRSSIILDYGKEIGFLTFMGLLDVNVFMARFLEAYNEFRIFWYNLNIKTKFNFSSHLFSDRNKTKTFWVDRRLNSIQQSLEFLLEIFVRFMKTEDSLKKLNKVTGMIVKSGLLEKLIYFMLDPDPIMKPIYEDTYGFIQKIYSSTFLYECHHRNFFLTSLEEFMVNFFHPLFVMLHRSYYVENEELIFMTFTNLLHSKKSSKGEGTSEDNRHLSALLQTLNESHQLLFIESCATCGSRKGKEVKKLRKCQCELISYCSSNCQRSDWEFHKELHRSRNYNEEEEEEEEQSLETKKKKKKRYCSFCKKKICHKSALRCSGCKQANYCGRNCQTNDWKVHKDLCVLKRKKK